MIYMLGNPLGVMRSDFPSSVAWSLAGIFETLRGMHLCNRNMMKAARETRGSSLLTLQSYVYKRVVENWKWYSDPQALAEEQKGGLEEVLRQRGEKQLGLPPQRSRTLARKWVGNFKRVVRHVPPRVATCLLRAGLHGWFTSHRFGEGSICCFLCNQYHDSLSHIACLLYTSPSPRDS